MNRILLVILCGCIVWLVPFLIAIPLYSPDGTLLIDGQVFKSIMIVIGAVTGAFLLVRLYRGISTGFIREGFIIGGLWLLINWILDLIILLPLSGMNPVEYFGQIGLRYLMIPVMSVMAGYIAYNAGSTGQDVKEF